MKHKFLFFLGICIMVVFSRNMYGQLNSEELSNLVEQSRLKFNLPAVSVVTMNSSNIVLTELQGVRVQNIRQEVELNDYFHIGSCSKSVTAFIAGKLIESGKINWETPFFEIYPELKEESNQEYYNVTLEDLFLCKAGIRAYTSADEKYPVIDTSQSNIRYQFSKYLLQQPSSSKYNRGKFDFFYSNASYAIAASMLEGVSGQTYEELITLYLDKELGINTYIGFPNTLDSNQPWGHMINSKSLEEFSPDHEYKLNDLITPAGNLSMSPIGFARYIQLNLKGLNGDDNFISSNTYNHIHFAHKGFSVGVINAVMAGYKYSGMDGSAGTFFCRAIIVPDCDFAFMIMTNAGSGTGRMKSIDWLTMKILKKNIIGGGNFGYKKQIQQIWIKNGC